jgi:hypothetical protein
VVSLPGNAGDAGDAEGRKGGAGNMPGDCAALLAKKKAAKAARARIANGQLHETGVGPPTR